MKRLTAGISLLVPVAAGAVRWLDLVNFCDLTTGFVLLGPVWARYLCMAMVLSLGVLASFLAARRPSGLVRRSMSLGLLCLLLMFCSGINIKITEELGTKSIFGKHTLNNFS